MRIHVLTLFPALFDGFLHESIVRIAQEKGALEVDLVDFRAHATSKHSSVDDRPFGGGPGMLLKPEPVFAAVESIEQARGELPKLLLTPSGRPLDQSTLERLATLPEFLMLCGRYEGFDERIHQGFAWEEVSLGDFVLSGGEVPAMAIIDGVARLLPGVLGDAESAERESFRSSDLLDYPQYTRPRSFRGMDVPEVLLSGNHAEIDLWRQEQALERTRRRQRRLGGTDATGAPNPMDPNEPDPNETNPCQGPTADRAEP